MNGYNVWKLAREGVVCKVMTLQEKFEIQACDELKIDNMTVEQREVFIQTVCDNILEDKKRT